MCKADTDPDVWMAHRKERKKIASARWYAKKKRREIQEECKLRQTLEMQYQAKLSNQPNYVFWRNAEDRWHWQSLLDHAVRGYPVRPNTVPPEQWCTWTRTVEDQLQYTRAHLRGAVWQGVPWDDRFFTKILRQLGIRELRSSHPRDPRHHHSEPTTQQQSKNSSHPPSPLWTCGPWGALFAGLVRRGWPLAWWPHIIRITYQLPTQRVPTSQTHPTVRHVHHSTAWTTPNTHPAPHHTPQPKADTNDDVRPMESEVFQDLISIVTWTHWIRWMQHHLFPTASHSNNPNDPTTTVIPVSWYDSDDEREWYEQWRTQPPSVRGEEDLDEDDDLNHENLSDWWPDSLDSSEDTNEPRFHPSTGPAHCPTTTTTTITPVDDDNYGRNPLESTDRLPSPPPSP